MGISTSSGLTTISSTGLANQMASSAGTVYSLTNTPAAIVFGTASPTLTLALDGQYLIMARAKVLYNAATFVTNRTQTLKIRRTNNTASDLANGTVTVTTSIITAITGLCSDQSWSVIYSATAGDVITLFGDISTLPSAGTIDVTDSSLIAIKL